MVVIHKEKKFKLDFEKLRSIANRYICIPLVPHDINEKGIIIPGGMKDEFIPLVVKERGNECKSHVEPGDIVFIRHNAGVFMGSKRETEGHRVIINESEILSFLKADDLTEVEGELQELDEKLREIKPIAQA